ncbi:MAG: hypothetical protein KBC53_12580 [Nitrosomonas sp.]|nr:hypothetical protein [Nitrosomonas sp.]
MGIKVMVTEVKNITVNIITEEVWNTILSHLKQKFSVVIHGKYQDLHWEYLRNDISFLPSLDITLCAARNIVLAEGMQFNIPANSRIFLRAGESDSSGHVVLPNESCPFISVVAKKTDNPPIINIYSGFKRPEDCSREYYESIFKGSNCEIACFSFLRAPEELIAVGNSQASMSDNYFLLNDIDCSGIQWDPIGAYQWPTIPFSGVFDGNNHVIHGVHIYNQYDQAGLAFLSEAEDATIKNLILKIKHDVGKEVSVSGLVGTAKKTKISDVIVYGEIKAGASSSISGIVAAIEDSSLERVGFVGKLSSTEANVEIGGIVGISRGSLLKEIFFDGTITAGERALVGGICLECTNSEVNHAMVLGREVCCGLGQRRDPIIDRSICAGMVVYAEDAKFSYCAMQLDLNIHGTLGYVSGFCGIGVGVDFQHGYSNTILNSNTKLPPEVRIVGGVANCFSTTKHFRIHDYYYNESLGALISSQELSGFSQPDVHILTRRGFID